MENICIIKEVYKAIYKFENEFVKKNGLTINEVMVLCSLKNGEQFTSRNISDHLGLSNSRISKVIKSMEDKKLIKRRIDKEDRRQMYFSIASAGREIVAMQESKACCFDELMSTLSNLIKHKD